MPVTEGLAAFNVLQSRGVPSKLLVFPDENHVSPSAPWILVDRRLTLGQWVLKPENSLVWHNEVIGWLNKYSGVGDKDDATVSR